MKDNFNDKIFAHRGVFNNLNIPENSIKAFKKALNNNYNIELDIQLTKDNRLIVFHDYNLFRMTGKSKLVKNCTYDEIKDLKLLNTNERIPLFSEVLKLINDKVCINIEIKNKDRKKKTLLTLASYLKGYHNFIIQSFYINYLIMIDKKYKDYKKGLLVSIPKKYNSYKLLINKTNLDFYSLNKDLVKREKIKKLRKKVKILCWTIKLNDINKYKEYCDGFIVNIR